MRPLFDKIVLARILVACMIVVPPVLLFQRSVTNEQATKLNTERSERNEQIARSLVVTAGQIAQERIDRNIDACNAKNQQRIATIATSEALIRIAASGSPGSGSLSQRDQLLLAAFVEKANKTIESATKPDVCTITALNLQPLVGIVNAADRVKHGLPVELEPDGTITTPHSTPTTTAKSEPPPTPTTRPSPPTTIPPKQSCVKKHGRCPPKVITGGTAIT